jgi:hypothetical protein
MSKYKIDYNGWSDEASPIKTDVKIKTSHAKLVSQKQNALARVEWGKKNAEKSKNIARIGGNKVGKTKEGRKRMSVIGKEYGPNNAVEFIPIETKQRNGKKYGKLNLTSEILCEKCGKTVNKGNYAQSHGKKCKELNKINLINLLPNKFTQSIVKGIADENGIKNWKSFNIFHDTCPYTKCIIKVDKPNQFNPSWYSKNIKEINKVKKYLNQ